MKNLSLALIAILFCVSATPIFSQKAILKGRIADSLGTAIVGATIKSGSTGTISNSDGNFQMEISFGKNFLQVSSVGYKTLVKEVSVESPNATFDFILQADQNELNEVIVTGSRSLPRSSADTPLPLDVLQSSDLKMTAQTSFDKQLQYKVPSFNTINAPVNDATTLLDPYEIRNLGPSRTLILINGKRKNLSSLLYVQFSPGRGETGADLSAIPTDAIKRVEILRDGASAQYGSDAIAGVLNVILKDKVPEGSLTLGGGITHNGDGENGKVSFIKGFTFKNNGFLQTTFEVSQQESAVRSGVIDRVTEKDIFGGTQAVNQAIDAFLDKFPTGNNLNGTGRIQANKFSFNFGIDLPSNKKIYANGALVQKSVFSFANYRPPYWRTDAGLLHKTQPTAPNYTGTSDPLYNGYIGYHPTFNGNLFDANLTIGMTQDGNGWKKDLSFTTGKNSQRYTVENTVNKSMGANSPTKFKPGGYQFSHFVMNYDLTRRVNDHFSIAFGSEARSETYVIEAGDSASFYGEGSNSFPGINKANAGKNVRYNMGVYLDATWDITKSFLLNGAVRGENYSDFGGAFVWKLSSRLFLLDEKLTLRGSYSTGFRAPTLHQIYAQSTQGSYFSGSSQLSGLFNNKSIQANQLGIPKLKPEYSTNMGIGIGINPSNNFSITVDYYHIDIKDRIVYSSTISTNDPTTELYRILAAEGLKDVSFFINGIQTKTEGVDLVLNVKNNFLFGGKFGINVAGNFQISNEIVGKPIVPNSIEAAGASILNVQLKSLLTESRPQYKMVFGADWRKNKINFTVNNTLFGPTKFQDTDNGGVALEHLKQVFLPGWVTDLALSIDLSPKTVLQINANNVLNIVPKWELQAIDEMGKSYLNNPESKHLLEGYLTFANRYPIVGYNGSQFSQLGRTYQTSLIFRF